MAASLLPAVAWADDAEALASDRAAGERLYREGRHADGRPLMAERLQGLSVRGAESACIACHRPSGMGGAEGSQAVPPVAGDLLRAP
ncbi:MAG TPA: cytochrome C, partial [Burkholderiaceae bacterium]|nr:cytochrome C [Burkholderiaceae bacterium]